MDRRRILDRLAAGRVARLSEPILRRSQPWRRYALVAVLGTVAVAVRVWRFGDVPPGLNIDEVSGAYDAFALLQRGIDRSGLSYPAIFAAYGSGMHPLAYYLAMPFLFLFGIHPWTIRMPALLVNLVSLPAFALLGEKAGGRRMAILCFFLLAVAPWHVLVSRFNQESTSFPAFFLLGVVLLVVSLEQRRLLPVTMLVFGLCLYVYGPALFLIPTFLALSIPLLVARGRLRPRDVLAGLAIPIGAFLAVNQFGLATMRLPALSIPRLSAAPRYQTASILFEPGGVRHAIANLGSLCGLLWTQEDTLVMNSVPGYGALYLWTLPVIVLGIAVALRSLALGIANDVVTLVVIWLMSGICLAAVSAPTLNRVNVLYPALLFFAAMALDALRRSRAIFATLVGAYVVSFAGFVTAYFGTYPAQIGPFFYDSLAEAIDEASAATSGTVCVTHHVSVYRLSYVYILLAQRIDPRAFLETARFEDSGPGFQSVTSFGRYVVGLDNCRGRSIGAYVIDPSESLRLPRAEYAVTPFTHYLVAVPRP